jgi:hypothetical protein
MTAPSEFPARAESFVDVLPEAPRLPQAAGLGVAHAGHRHADDLGELRLCEPGGAAEAFQDPAPKPGGQVFGTTSTTRS